MSYDDVDENSSKSLGLETQEDASGQPGFAIKRKRRRSAKSNAVEAEMEKIVQLYSLNTYEVSEGSDQDEPIDDSDAEERGTFQRSILPVASALKDEAAGPQSGEEYLLMVRREARLLPSIVSVDIDISHCTSE